MLSPNQISDSDKEEMKFFRPKFLTAGKWSKDEIELTLERHFSNENSDSKSEE